MSYTPNTWQKGDVVTSAKLNNIEQGIANAGGVLVVDVTMEGETPTLDKTWQQLHDAPIAILKSESDDQVSIYFLCIVASMGGEFRANFTSLATQGETIYTTATTADGYPIITDE